MAGLLFWPMLTGSSVAVMQKALSFATRSPSDQLLIVTASVPVMVFSPDMK
jgi:hypothetical protein